MENCRWLLCCQKYEWPCQLVLSLQYLPWLSFLKVCPLDSNYHCCRTICILWTQSLICRTWPWHGVVLTSEVSLINVHLPLGMSSTLIPPSHFILILKILFPSCSGFFICYCCPYCSSKGRGTCEISHTREFVLELIREKFLKIKISLTLALTLKWIRWIAKKDATTHLTWDRDYWFTIQHRRFLYNA